MLKFETVKNDHRLLTRAFAQTTFRFDDMKQETADFIERSAASLALVESGFGSESVRQGLLDSAYCYQARAWNRVRGYVS